MFIKKVIGTLIQQNTQKKHILYTEGQGETDLAPFWIINFLGRYTINWKL